MEPAPKPADEVARLVALFALDILDTAAAEAVERATRMAKRIFQVPFALVTFIEDDRQWVMSGLGESCSFERSTSFCGHALMGPDLMTVRDTREDPRFADNPWVTADPGVRFYAGAPLTLGGRRVGTFCLYDDKPRDFSEDEAEILRDLAASVEAEFSSAQLAVVDELTGLYNRRGFQRVLDHMLPLAERHGEPVTIFALDLDGLKLVNDREGHAAGDALIGEAAGLLRATFRASDTIARVGGDEFGVLCYGTCEAGGIRERLALPEDGPSVPRFSVGWATADAGSARSVDEMLAVADARMYEDKSARRAVAT